MLFVVVKWRPSKIFQKNAGDNFLASKIFCRVQHFFSELNKRCYHHRTRSHNLKIPSQKCITENVSFFRHENISRFLPLKQKCDLTTGKWRGFAQLFFDHRAYLNISFRLPKTWFIRIWQTNVGNPFFRKPDSIFRPPQSQREWIKKPSWTGRNVFRRGKNAFSKVTSKNIYPSFMYGRMWCFCNISSRLIPSKMTT